MTTDDILHNPADGSEEPQETAAEPTTGLEPPKGTAFDDGQADGVLHAPDPQNAAARALVSVPKNEDDYSARVRAKTLSEAVGQAIAVAKRKAADAAATPEERDERERATADAIGTILSGKHDYYGAMWNRQKPFASGAEYAAHMRRLVLEGPGAGLTDEAKTFYDADYDTQVRLAMEHEGVTDWLKRGAADALDALRAVQPLTRAEEANADEETRAASATVAVANMGGTKVEDERLESARAKVSEFRERQQREAVRRKYEEKLNRDNAWNALTTILPTLSEDAQACAKAIIDSPDNALPQECYAKFNALPQGERELVVQTRQLTKERVDSGFWNTLGDAAIGAANITSSIITAPFRQASKYEGIVRDAVTNSDAAGLAVNDLAIRRQLLWQATGNFFAGGDLRRGELPQLQFEQVCEDHGVVGEAVIGAISTLPYMGAAAIPYAGPALVALEAMQEFDDHVALNGGDVTDPRYLMSSLVMGGLYAYVERLQVDKLVGGVTEQRVREGLLKGFWDGVRNGTVPRVLTAETVSESLQEGLQNGIMSVNNALALGEDAVRAFGEGFVEDFVGSLGTMLVVSGGGLVVGHAKRTGLHLRGQGDKTAADLRQASRSKDLSDILMAEFAFNNMVEANSKSKAFRKRAVDEEIATLCGLWQEGGKAALVEKGGVSERTAERLDEFFVATRAAEGSDAQARSDSAIEEWNRGRGVETAPRTGERGDIGQQYLENLVGQLERGEMSREDFTSRLVSMGFSESGASAYAEWTMLERDAKEKAAQIAEFIQGRYEGKHGSEEAEAEDYRLAGQSMRDLRRARDAWAKGMGIYRVDADGTVHDPGAKALEEFGFTKEDASRLSRLFHYERAVAYSRVALDGIRALYEKETKGRVSGKAALASEFKGRVVRLPTGTDARGKTTYGDFIKFALPKNGGDAYVQIVERPTLERVDFTQDDVNVARSIAESTKAAARPITEEEWMAATPAERERLFEEYRLRDEAVFRHDPDVSLVLDGDPSARVTSGEAKRLVFGTITIATQSEGETLDKIAKKDPIDSSAGFHEVYHAWEYFMKATGQWTEKEESALAAKYGKTRDGRHDEEAAANAMRAYMNRRVEGRMTADDEKSPFSKIYSLAMRLIRRGQEKKVQEQVAKTAEDAFFAQIVADNYTGIGDLGKKEEKKEDAQPAATVAKTAEDAFFAQIVADNYTGIGDLGKKEEKKEDAQPAATVAKPSATPKPAAQRGWTAYTPTGNVKVGGYYAVVDLADVVHSNNPLYSLYMRAQLRNRKNNKAEEDTRKDIVNNFQGERLLEAPDTANGAPIVFLAPDENGADRMFVLSGNGRVLVLNELAERHLYDQYRNVMKAWASENGLEVPEGETPVLVRVITDFGGATREKVADLSNTNSIQQYTEEEQARADAEVVKALGIANLYHANANGTPDMTPGVNDDFFSKFIRGVGDTSLYNSDRSLTETARTRAVRALLAIAVGQGDRGRDVVKKLIEQTDTLGIARQKNAAAIMAASVAALEAKPEYAIGPDVSRAMADYIDFAEKKKADRIGTFDEYFRQMDLLDAPSEVAREVLALFGSKQPAADIAEYVVAYCDAATKEDPTGGLFGADAARSRIEIWNDAKRLVEGRRASDGGAAKHSFAAETRPLYHGSAANWIRPDLRHAGEGQGGDYQGYGLNMTTSRSGAEFWARAAKNNAGRRARGVVASVKILFSPEYVYSAELDDGAKTIGYWDPVPKDLVKSVKSVLLSEGVRLTDEESDRLTALEGKPFERLSKFLSNRRKDGVRIAPKTTAEILVKSGIDASWTPSTMGRTDADRDITVYNLEKLRNYHQWANGTQKYSFAANPVRVTQEDFDAALAKYGEAKDASQAVYALPDGRLLRGKGKHVVIPSAHIDVMSFGHDGFTDDILAKTSDDPSTKDLDLREHLDAIKRAIAQTGAIRIASGSGLLEVFKEPTDAQYDRFYDIVYDTYADAERNGEETDFTIDVSDADLNTAFSVTYRANTSPRRMLEDLRGWYRDGVLPLGARGPAADAARVDATPKHSFGGVDFTATAKYYQGDVREIARQLKKGNPYALKLAAESMARAVPNGAVLVPVPSHDGRARDTLALANEIAAITGSPVVDAIRSEARASVYEQKSEGYLPSATELGFKAYRDLPNDREVIFVDNVVGTGTTAVAAHDALGRGRVLAFAWDNTAPRPVGIVGGLDADYGVRHSFRADVAASGKALDDFADRKGIKAPKRRAALKKAADDFAKFADEYRLKYRDAIRYGDWKDVLDFAEQNGRPFASNVLKEYFTDPKFETKELVGLQVADSADVAAILMTVRSPFVESVKAIYLDADRRILDAKILTIGQPSNASISKGAVTREMPDGAKFVVISHNHPSGIPSPSDLDFNLTNTVQAELAESGVQLLDHIITDGNTYYSFNDHGTYTIYADRPKWEMYPAGDDAIPTFRTSEQTRNYVAAHLRDDGDSGHVVYLNTQNAVVGVKRIPSGGAAKGADAGAWVERVVKDAAKTGAVGAFVDLGPVSMEQKSVKALAESLGRRFGTFNVHVLDILSGKDDDLRSWSEFAGERTQDAPKRQPFPKYSFAAGEIGSANMKSALFLSANLDRARQMLGKRDWQKITRAERLAIKTETGWEKGADGKWRLEITDLPEIDMARLTKPNADYEEMTVKEANGDPALCAAYLPVRLGSLWTKKEQTAIDLFDAYPWLRDLTVVAGAKMTQESVRGMFVEKTGTIFLNDNLNDAETVREVLAHEIQHAIQKIEDFARGGSQASARKMFFKRYAAAHKESEGLEAERYSLINEFLVGYRERAYFYEWPKRSAEHKEVLAKLREHPDWIAFENAADAFKKKFGHQFEYFLGGAMDADAKATRTQFADYRKFAGEVEARNAAKRKYDPFSLLEDTEDVERRYQTLVDGNMEEFQRLSEAQEAAEKHSFAGLRAANVAGICSIDDAEAMEQRGDDRETIFRLTGWFRGADGLWRVELPFHGRFAFEGDFDGGTTKGYRTVSDYFEWPELFEAYPEMRDVEVRFEDMPDGVRGDFDPKTKTIRIANAVRRGGSGILARHRVAPVMVHEIQHAIQSIENHARGGDPDDFLTWDRTKVHDLIRRLSLARELADTQAEKDELSDMIAEHERNLADDAAIAAERYFRLAGEVEARNAANRFYRSPSWRLANPPWETEEVERERQVVEFSEDEDVHWGDVAAPRPSDVFDANAEDDVEIPVAALRTYKDEPGKSVLNAARFMAEAMDGRGAKRAPLLVADNGDGTYAVVDGTATSKALAAVGAETVYAKVVGPDKGNRLLNSAYAVENVKPEGGVLRATNAATLDEAIAQASENADALAALCHAAAAKAGGKVKFRKTNPETGKPTKKRASAERKLRDEYAGDASRLVDLAGGTVVIDDDGDFRDALKAIERNLPDGASIVRVKKFHLEPTDKGYGDIKVNVRFANGGVGEIILVGRGMFEGKEMRGGHEVYNIARVIRKHSGKSAKIDEAIAALNELSNAIYAAGVDALDAANFASMKARASSSITCLIPDPSVQAFISSSDMEAVKSMVPGLNLAKPPSQNSNATPALSLMKNMDASLIDAVRKTISRPTADSIAYSGVGAQGDISSASSPDFGIRHSITSAWGDGFPDVTYMTTRKFVLADPELDRLHHEAKAGNLPSALEFVSRLLPDKPKTESEKMRMRKIKDLAADYPKAILVPVFAIEQSGHNMLPFAYAQRIHEITGLDLSLTVRQSVKANHTGASAFERLTRRAEFVGGVMRGRNYIMVDDHVTQGGTFAELRRHILDRGGKVVAATTLTTSRGSSILSPRDSTLDKLITKFGRDFAAELRKAGIADELADLTESQAQQLLKYSADSFRALAARAVDRRRSEISHQDGQGYAGELRAALRPGEANQAGTPQGMAGRMEPPAERGAGIQVRPVRRTPAGGPETLDVSTLIPELAPFYNWDTHQLGDTYFAKSPLIRGPISKKFHAAIEEAGRAGKMSGEEKLALISRLVETIKGTKEGKTLFARYKTGDSWDGTDAAWNEPSRARLREEIFHDLAFAPVSAKNNEALETVKATGKPKRIDVIERANADQEGLPRIETTADAHYAPERGHRLDIVVGPPAAGKSSVFVDLLSVYHHARVFDSDAIKKRLPGFDGGNGASYVHEESSRINKEMISRFLDRNTGENVVLPIVGASEKSVRKYIDQFRNAGYTIYLHNNYVPILHAFHRAWKRTLSTGRLIAPEVFLGCMDSPTSVFEKMKDAADFWDEFDNDGPLGSKPLYVRGNYRDPAYGRISEKKTPEQESTEAWKKRLANPQTLFDLAQEMDREERDGEARPLFEPRERQGVFKFSFSMADPEARARQAIRADLRDNRGKAADEALTNWITYFRLSHGSVPMAKTIARMGLAMGMSVVDTKRILRASENRAEQMRGSLIEKAAQNGDVATTMALLKREDGIDESIDALLAGGVAKGGELTHKGVGQINTIIGRRVDQMMRDFSAASLADMEGETGLDIAAEILEQNPDAFSDEIKGARGTDPNAANADNAPDTDANGGATGEIDESQLSDLERYKREEARKEALKKVEDFIARAKERAAENRTKAEDRRRRDEENGGADGGGGGDGTGGDPNDGDMEQAVSNALGGTNPKNVKGNFKTKEEFAAFMRIWAEHKFDKTHGISSLGKSERDKLFAEFYRITVRQELQDLADKLLAPKDENGATISRIAKLGNGARNVVSRKLGRMEKGLRADTIERMSADIFAFINSAAIRVSRTDLVNEFKKEIKARFVKGDQYDDLKLDADRRVTGWVEEAARYICRVCDLSKRSINGDPSQFVAERKKLLDIVSRRADVYEDSGKDVARAALEDMETKKAMWKLALLDKYGAMTALMPGKILDLRKAAIEYLEKQAGDLERLWQDTRVYEDSIRRDLTGAIVAPNGQRYQPKGWLNGRLFDALNGLLRLRLQHLTRFADEDAQEQAKNAINKIIVMLADGETQYNLALQNDRRALFEGLARIFNKGGRADNAAIKRYINRMTEPIPVELSQRISTQGFVGTMTYGQMLQLLVSLEQRSFKDAIEHNGRQGQAELIRSFTTTDKDGKRTNVFTAEDNMFIEWLRAFYASKRDVISPVTLRMVGQQVESPDPLYCPVKRSMDDRVMALADAGSTWDPIAAVFSRRVENNRDFDEQASILGMFFDRSNETAKLVAWAESGTIIRGVFTNPGVQGAIRRAFGSGELRKIMTQLLATFNGGESKSKSPGELAAVDKALNFTTYAYLGFNPLSSLKQTTSFTVWANVLPGGFKDLWKYMTHFDRKALQHLKESDEYRVRYGNDVGSGQDMATRGLNENPSMNPVVRMLSGAGMWMLKKADWAPGGWIAQGVYKDFLDKHMQEGLSFDEADRLAITETFNLLEETQQSGRTYNTNMLTIEHGRIGRLLTQFATSPLQQLQYETQAWREWRDMKRYGQGEKKIAAARQKLLRAAVINHLLIPAALNFVTAVYKTLMGDEPPWEQDGYHWTLLTEVIMGQYSRVFFLGALAQTSLKALFSREYPRGSQILPVEGVLGMGASLMFTAHDVATLDAEKVRKDVERLLRSTAPTRIPYNLYRRIIGDSDVDRKEKQKAKKRK